jgi:uncharacterized protein YecE (DUF72 family)
MRVWIGTSGYSFPDWVGPFYPAGTRPNRMLGHYCRAFPLVELNFTFYRPPTAEMLARLARQTPTNFQFLVKLPRSLTHEESPHDLPGFRLAVDALMHVGKLSGLLCQLPQAAHRTRTHIAWLERLARELGDYRLAAEFRHRSWANSEVTAWMREQSLDLVAVDVPDLPNLYPRGLVQSNERIYVRFHSRVPEKWYASGVERYNYDYDDGELTEWAAALAQRADRAELAYILFNNCAGGQAANNALRMRTIMEQRAPACQIIEPFPPSSEEGGQRALFD